MPVSTLERPYATVGQVFYELQGHASRVADELMEAAAVRLSTEDLTTKIPLTALLLATDGYHQDTPGAERLRTVSAQVKDQAYPLFSVASSRSPFRSAPDGPTAVSAFRANETNPDYQLRYDEALHAPVQISLGIEGVASALGEPFGTVEADPHTEIDTLDPYQQRKLTLVAKAISRGITAATILYAGANAEGVLELIERPLSISATA